MLAILLSGLMLTHSEDQINFESRAASVEQVLEKLSAQQKAKFKSSPEIASQIIYVRAEKISLTELKAKLAEVTVGTWVKQTDAEVLLRTPAQTQGIFQAHISYRRKLLDQALEKVRKLASEPFDAKKLAQGLASLPSEKDVENDRQAATRRWIRQTALFEQAPMSRFLNRLVLACNPNDLAGIGPFQRAVFSVEPTRMQRKIDPKKFEKALLDFKKEQLDWEDQASRLDFPQESPRTVSDPRSQLNINVNQPFSLEVIRGEMTALFNVNLIAENPDFGPQVKSQAMFADPARTFLNAQLNPTSPSLADPIVKLSDDSKLFNDRAKTVFGGSSPATISARLKEMMLGVEKVDPLSWTVSDALESYAETSKLNVIGLIPDEAMTMTLFTSQDQPLRVGRFMRSLLDSGTINLVENGTWSTITPCDHFESALNFTPRGATAKLMASVFAKSRLDVRDYARYAYESKRLNRSGLGDIFVLMVDRSLAGASDNTDWDTLCLYGSFEPKLQASLESGAQFGYRGLRADQRKIVDRMTFRSRILRGKELEPTELFADGVPDTAFVSARTTLLPTLVAYGRAADGHVFPLRDLQAYTLAVIETEVMGNPNKMQSYGVTGLVGYAPGKNGVIRLRLDLAPKVWKEHLAITVPEFDLNAVPVTWDKLPDPYPAQVRAAIAEIKATKANETKRSPPPR
ncbi:MAG: hypothetical protein ABL949_06895 [Fimbriimonadaceae bacterium]